MRVFVTGANSSIGKYIVPKLVESDYVDEIYLTSRQYSFPSPNQKIKKFVMTDLNNLSTMTDLKDLESDVVIHLAGEATNKPRVIANNIQCTKNLIDTIPPPKKCFINASSITVYGNHNGNGKEWRETDNCNPTSEYSISKLACEHLINASLGGVTSVIHARLCAVTGYGFTHGLIADVVRKLQLDSKVIELFGCYPGSCKPYIYAGDVANIMLKMALLPHKETECNAYNVCGIGSLTVADIVEICQEALGTNKEMFWLGDRAVSKGDNRMICATQLKLQTAGLWTDIRSSSRGIRAGLKDIVNKERYS